jgi:hypothetical protein
LNNALFLVIESDLRKRFEGFIRKTGFPCEDIGFNSIYRKNIFFQILLRFFSIPVLYFKFLFLNNKISESGFLFVSNAEGYVAANIIYWIKKKHPDIVIVALQHGLFPLAVQDRKKSKLMNKITIIFGFYLSGFGFGYKNVDKYIVYNSFYKSFLLKCGWLNSDVFISSYFLKDLKDGLVCKQKANAAVYFLQPLSCLGVCSVIEEREINSKVIDYLLSQYGFVYFKQHPFARVDVNISDRVIELSFSDSEVIESALAHYSCFSTALLDYAYTGAKTVAVKSKYLKVEGGVYNFFPYVLDLDSPVYSERVNEDYCLKGSFYEIGIDDINVVLK